MNTMKKLISLLIVSALSMSLAACGGGDTSPNDNSPSGVDRVDSQAPASTSADGAEESALTGTCNLFTFEVENYDNYVNATKRYMELNPGTTVTIETVGGGQDHHAFIKTKMAGSEPPTMFTNDDMDMAQEWYEADYLEDLSDQPWVEYVREGLLDDTTIDGKVYGLPVDLGVMGFIYNKRIFEAAGVSAEGLDTFDKIDEAFGQLKAKIDSGELKEQFPNLEAVIELPAGEKWVTGRHMPTFALGHELTSNRAAYLATSIEFQYADQLKELLDLQVKYSPHADMPSALNAVDYAAQLGGGFSIERVAVIQQGKWIYPEVLNVDPEVASNIGMLPMPIRGVAEDHIATGLAGYFFINKNAAEMDKAVAKDFLNWLFQSDEGKHLVTQVFSYYPVFTNYEGYPSNNMVALAGEPYIESGKTTPFMYTGEPSGWSDSFGAKIQAYLSDSMTWDEVIDEVKVEWAEARS